MDGTWDLFLLVIKIRQRRIVTYDVRRRGNVTTCHYPRDEQLRRDGIGGRLERDTRLRELQLAAATAHKKKKNASRSGYLVALLQSHGLSTTSVDFCDRRAKLGPSFFHSAEGFNNVTSASRRKL